MAKWPEEKPGERRRMRHWGKVDWERCLDSHPVILFGWNVPAGPAQTGRKQTDGGAGGGVRGGAASGCRCLFGVIKVFWNETMVTIAQLCEHTKNSWLVHFQRVDFMACELHLKKKNKKPEWCLLKCISCPCPYQRSKAVHPTLEGTSLASLGRDLMPVNAQQRKMQTGFQSWLSLSVARWMTLGKWRDLSEPLFLHCQVMMIILFISYVSRRINMLRIVPGMGQVP